MTAEHLQADTSSLVLRELTRLFYEQLPRALLFNLLVSTVFVSVSWAVLPKIFLLSWYGTLLVITLLRYLLLRRFLSRGLENIAVDNLTGAAAAIALVVGCTWAVLSAVLLMTDLAIIQIMATLMICGLAAGAMSSHSYLLPSYIGFMAPQLLALVGVFLWQWTEQSVAVAALLLMYMGYLILSARQFHDNIARSITLALENELLTTELTQSKTQLEKTVVELERLSTADALTAVANRRRYEDYIRDAWANCRRAREAMSLVLLDIDHFKDYNDEYGHQMGDQCLVQVAAAIQSCSKRDIDLVARIGGEEFVVIMPSTNALGALNMAEKVHQAIVKLDISHRASPVARYVTASLGVATADPVGEGDYSKLVGAADRALYEAKDSGRDLVVVSETLLA